MKRYIRVIVQICFFALIGLIAVNHTLSESGRALHIIGTASIHAICPFGTVAGIYQLITTGTFVKKVQGASLIVLYLVLFLSLLFGPVFCGWMCPLGSLQEWVRKIGKIFKIPQVKLPHKLDVVLRKLRYIVLIVVVIMTARMGELMFNAIDPYYAIFNFWTDDFIVTSGYVLMGVVLIGLVIERAWCKYICPFGALLGVANKLRVFKLKRRASTCVNCKMCSKVCPMDIPVHDREVVNDLQCIGCMQCTSDLNCPVNDTLQLQTASSKQVGLISIGLTIILVMVLGVYGAILTNNFATETVKIPDKIEGTSEYDPSTIKGSYAFTDISDLFDIPLGILGKAYGIPEDEWETVKNKDLKERYVFEDEIELGNGSVKMFIALYKNLPYDYETEGDYIPMPAFLILEAEGKILPDQRAYIEAHKVELPE